MSADRGADPGGQVGGMVLAAGTGRRLGRVKALVELGGRSLVERAVLTLETAGCDPVIVVLGASSDEVSSMCELGDAVVVRNDTWQEGLGGSLRTGLSEAQSRGVSAVVVLLVDQPLIGPELVERLIGSWRAGALAAVATYDGEPATPVVLDRSLWREVASSAVGDMGARVFLRSNPDVVTYVACEDVGDPSDIDTEDDLRRVEDLLRGGRWG